jgi:aminoglycoside/choline kinase family phosphotransferase
VSVLVRRPRDLDEGWARRVLADAAPGVVVRGVETRSVDVGTTTRVRLRVDHDGPQSLPRTWFVKLPSRSWKAWAVTALPRLPQTEVRFYNDVAQLLPRVTTPRVLAADSQIGRGFLLVLEDVTERGARPGSPGDALDAEQAGLVIEQLALLHASHWEHSDLDGRLAWLAGPVRRLEDGLGTALAVPLMRRGLDLAGDVIPRHLRHPALRYARRRRRAMRFLSAGPRTLIHHDCHPGNLYWQEGAPGLLDWQLVRIGEGVGDVAYLLATALQPETRRAHEDALLERYASALAAAGVDLPPNLHQRYRAHLTYAFEAMVVTLAVGGLMDEAVISELVRRTAAAVDDCASFAAVE